MIIWMQTAGRTGKAPDLELHLTCCEATFHSALRCSKPVLNKAENRNTHFCRNLPQGTKRKSNAQKLQKPPHPSHTWHRSWIILQPQQWGNNKYLQEQKMTEKNVFICFKTGFLYVDLVSWNSLCRLGWPQAHRDLPASVYWVLEIKVCTTVTN